MVDSVARDAHFAPLPGLWGGMAGLPPSWIRQWVNLPSGGV